MVTSKFSFEAAAPYAKMGKKVTVLNFADFNEQKESSYAVWSAVIFSEQFPMFCGEVGENHSVYETG